jgi:parallel beta-helix repeat protein
MRPSAFRQWFGFAQRSFARTRSSLKLRLFLERLEDRTVPASVHDLTTHLDFATIQAAVNAANPGDTILVDAGTYNEMVTVNKSLTIEGAEHGVDARTRSGAESIVQGPGGQTAFVIAANDVAIDGFTVQNATNGNVFGAGIYIQPGVSGTHIINDIVQDNIVGLFLSNSSSVDQAVIQHDLFRDNTQPGPASGTDMYADNFTAGNGGVDNVLIDGNTFTNSSVVENAWALGISNVGTTPFTGITFSNNTVTNHGRGLYLSDTTNSSITGNTITGASHYAIGLFGGDSGIQILMNDLSNNARGLEIGSDGTVPGANSNVTAQENNFASDNVFGVGIVDFGAGNGYSGTLDVSKNWWGNVSGPTAASNPSGTGAKIQNDFADAITYKPWATSPSFTSFTAGTGVVQIGTQLFIGGGATTNDNVDVDVAGTGISVDASLNGVKSKTTYSGITAINIFLQNGNENVNVDKSLTIPTNVTAGNGNDNIKLGNGTNTVQLGTGNDHIQAGDGTNTIMAGAAGSKGNIEIDLGNGLDNLVQLMGNGNDNVKAGDGNGDTVIIVGDGNDHVNLGDGNNGSVLLSGNGNNQVQIGNGLDDFVAIFGNGNETVHTGRGSGHVHLVGTGHRDLHLGSGWSQI